MPSSKKMKVEEAIGIIENVMIPQVNDQIARAETEMKKFESEYELWVNGGKWK